MTAAQHPASSSPPWHEQSGAPVIPPVLQEHLEEIAFLAIQRRKLLFSREVSLRDFLPHDERIAAHWDGLVIGASHSVKIALERLQEFDPWESAAAARVWMEIGNPSSTDIISHIDATDPAVHGSWREALRRLPRERAAELLNSAVLPPTGSAALPIVVFALGIHDLLPPQVAASCAFHSEPSVRAAVARTLGAAKGVPQADQLLSQLANDPEHHVRRVAVWSTAIRQPAMAAAQSRNRIRGAGADYFDLRILGLLGVPEDVHLIGALLRNPGELRQAAALVLGSMGNLQAVPLLENVSAEDPAFSEIARQAIAEIVDAPAPADGSMFSLWRANIQLPSPELEWLRNEVPDGFFEPALRSDAVPGE